MGLSGGSGGAGLAVAVWIAGVAAGFAAWEGYDSRPGAAGTPAARPDPPRGWELVVFAHPHCPCTRATLAEAAGLAREAGPALAVRAVFVRPPGAPPGWERTAMWDAAEAAGIGVGCDPDGATARRAGAETSGHAVLYDPAGRVAFCGGLTRGRGRVGESSGRRAVLALVAGGEPEGRTAPAFGCPLFGPDEYSGTKERPSCRE